MKFPFLFLCLLPPSLPPSPPSLPLLPLSHPHSLSLSPSLPPSFSLSLPPSLPQDGSCHYKPADIGSTCSGFQDIKSGSEADLQVASATVGPISVGIDASHLGFQVTGTHTHTHTYTHTHTHSHKHRHTRTCTHTQSQVHTRYSKCAHAHTEWHTYIKYTPQATYKL